MKRTSKYDIIPEILQRWSPRSFKPQHLDEEKLLKLFEAAKWAPSSYNNQPWRFIYALRDTPEWDIMFDLLIDFNKSWVKNASALFVIVSKTNFDYNDKLSITNEFDTGAAWQNINIQATHDKLYTHGMQGFDYEKAKKVLNIPEDHKVLAMATVGFIDDKNKLPKELQEKEILSDRKENYIFKGTM